jgi:hypothetical protein
VRRGSHAGTHAGLTSVQRATPWLQLLPPSSLLERGNVEFKPDLRVRDAVKNHIEIVANADKVLVYEQSISIAVIIDALS